MSAYSVLTTIPSSSPNCHGDLRISQPATDTMSCVAQINSGANISQVIKPQRLPVSNVERYTRTYVAPTGLQTSKLLRLDGKRHFANLRRTNRDHRIALTIVVNIHARKNVWRVELKFRVLGLCHGESKRKRAELPVRRADLPFTLTPINHARRILPHQNRPCGK